MAELRQFAALTTVSSSGTYLIEGFAASGTRAKGLKILKSSGATRTGYYVEFRQGSGFDSFLAGNANIANGVLFARVPVSPDHEFTQAAWILTSAGP